jgi:ABC-type transport system substrate-binding protein
MAVDRDALVSGPLGGFADPVEQIVAPEVGGYVHGLPRSQPQLEEARALLKAAGLGSGFAVTLDYTPEKYRAMQGVAEALQGQLARIGVVVALRPSPVAEFLGRLDGHTSRFFLEGWLTFRDAALSYAQLLHTPSDVVGKYNSSGYSDADLDRWIDLAESEAAGDDRDVHLRAIAERVLRDWPMIPLYRQRDLCAWSAEIAFTPHPDRSLPAAEFEWSR